MTYRGQEIRLKYGPSTKVMQLLAILLYNAPGQVTVNRLLDTLFAEDDVLNPKNNLKVSVSQLRKALPKAGIPGSVFITYKDGCYSWQNEIPVDLDVRAFDQVIRMAKEAGSTGYLVLMNLTDRSGSPLENEKTTAEAGEKVHMAIRNSLRSGDYFTQYNSGQFLIYLSSLTRENCDEVAERIRRNYRKDPVRGVHIFYSVAADRMKL
ncbi:MAG: hypothetical protein U0L49_11620 [Eubacterium sp.]|nr:hypothetical protein [Eubacterium sp.]